MSNRHIFLLALLLWLGWASGSLLAGAVVAGAAFIVLALCEAYVGRPDPPRVQQARPVHPHHVGRWFVGFSIPILGPIRIGAYRRIGS